MMAHDMVEPRPCVVEVIRIVPSEDVPMVAARVAERLNMPVERVRKLIDGRTGPITRPLTPTKADAIAQTFEAAGVSVVIRHATPDDEPQPPTPVTEPSAAESAPTPVPATVGGEADDVDVPMVVTSDEPFAERRQAVERRDEPEDDADEAAIEHDGAGMVIELPVEADDAEASDPHVASDGDDEPVWPTGLGTAPAPVSPEPVGAAVTDDVDAADLDDDETNDPGPHGLPARGEVHVAFARTPLEPLSAADHDASGRVDDAADAAPDASDEDAHVATPLRHTFVPAGEPPARPMGYGVDERAPVHEQDGTDVDDADDPGATVADDGNHGAGGADPEPDLAAEGRPVQPDAAPTGSARGARFGDPATWDDGDGDAWSFERRRSVDDGDRDAFASEPPEHDDATDAIRAPTPAGPDGEPIAIGRSSRVVHRVRPAPRDMGVTGANPPSVPPGTAGDAASRAAAVDAALAERQAARVTRRRTAMLVTLAVAIGLFVLAQAWVSGRAAPAFDAGLHRFRDADFGAAQRVWLQLAESGDHNAQFMVGYLSEAGLGRPWSARAAASWYRMAADAGHAEAQWRLGRLYAEGLGVPYDLAQAARWWSAAADGGHAEAAFRLATHHLEHGDGSLTNAAAHAALDRAVALGWPAARAYRDALVGASSGAAHPDALP